MFILNFMLFDVIYLCFETRVWKIMQLSTSVFPVFLHIMFFVFDVVYLCFETRVRKITQLSTSVSPVFLYIMFFVFDVIYLCFETRVRNINATKYLSVPCVSAYYLLHLSYFGSLCFETRVHILMQLSTSVSPVFLHIIYCI